MDAAKKTRKKRSNGAGNGTKHPGPVVEQNFWDFSAESWLFLHIVVPVATVAFIWARRGVLSRIIAQFDRIYLTNFCSAISKQERLLKWIQSRIIFTGDLSEFWSNGTLLCTLLNAAVPGACTNPHRHWKKTPVHGQALAYKYLGIIPTFTESDFEELKLTQSLEAKLLDYLTQIQQVSSKLSRNQEQTELQFTSSYIAKGMGLIAGDEKRKNTFFIYRNHALLTGSEQESIFLSVRGPYNAYGRKTIQPLFADNLLVQARKLSKTATSSNTNTSGYKKKNSMFFRSFDFSALILNTKVQLNDEIPIQILFENQRAKVTYIPQTSGVYEICLISNGFHLMGSPFNVQILRNMSGLEDTFEDKDNTQTKPSSKKVVKKRVVSRTIHFVDEEVSFEEHQSFQKACAEKVIKDQELLLEKERDSSTSLIMDDVTSKDENENDINFDEYEIVPNAYNCLQNCPSTESDSSKTVSGKNVEKLKQKYESLGSNKDSLALCKEDTKSRIQSSKLSFLSSTLASSSSNSSLLTIDDCSLATTCQPSADEQELLELDASPICEHIEQEAFQHESTPFQPPLEAEAPRTLEEKRKNLKNLKNLRNLQNLEDMKNSENLNDLKELKDLKELNVLRELHDLQDLNKSNLDGIETDPTSDVDNNMKILAVLNCLKREAVGSSLPNLFNNSLEISPQTAGCRTRSNSLGVCEISSVRLAYKERKAYWNKRLETAGMDSKKAQSKPKLNYTFSYSANDVSNNNNHRSRRCENFVFPSIEKRRAMFASESNISQSHKTKVTLQKSDSVISNESFASSVSHSYSENVVTKPTSRKPSMDRSDFQVHKEKIKERFLRAQKFFKGLEIGRKQSKVTQMPKS